MGFVFHLLLLLALASLSACSTNRSLQLIDSYHRAEPPNDLFVEVHEARYLGAPQGYPLLYYDFVWSGAKHSYRGTQKLLVFDANDQYLGYYYLGAPIVVAESQVDRQAASLVFDDGDRDMLIFGTEPPDSSASGELLFHLAGP